LEYCVKKIFIFKEEEEEEEEEEKFSKHNVTHRTHLGGNHT